QDEVVVCLAGVRDHAVAVQAVGGCFGRGPGTDHAETVGIVDVEQRSVVTADPRERRQVGDIAGHAVDPVHAHQLGTAGGGGAQQLGEVVGLVGVERRNGGAETPGVHAAVV